MKHALWILVAGVALAGAVVGGMAMIDKTSTPSVFVPSPPTVEYDEFEDYTSVRVTMPAYEQDGSVSMFGIRALMLGKTMDRMDIDFSITAEPGTVGFSGNSVDSAGVILLPDGERITSEFGNSLTGRFLLKDAQRVVISGSARMKWAGVEYEIREDGIAQIRAFLVELDKLRAK